jgi:hypothetical protein
VTFTLWIATFTRDVLSAAAGRHCRGRRHGAREGGRCAREARHIGPFYLLLQQAIRLCLFVDVWRQAVFCERGEAVDEGQRSLLLGLVYQCIKQ